MLKQVLALSVIFGAAQLAASGTNAPTATEKRDAAAPVAAEEGKKEDKAAAPVAAEEGKKEDKAAK